MTPSTLTKLDKLAITELSLVDDPANATPGWMILKQRGLVTEADELTPDGATAILKALVDPEHPLTAEDVLEPHELAKARSMQPRSFIQAFGAIRPPGRPR